MFKKFVPYFFVLFFVVSCYKLNEPEKPKNLISKENMVNILIDLQLGSSITSTEDLKILDTNNIQLEKYIYKKYNIDSTQFALSNNYYAFFIDDYEEIYNKVKDSLEVLSDFYEKLELKEREEAADTLSSKSTEKDSLKGMIKPVSDIDYQPKE